MKKFLFLFLLMPIHFSQVMADATIVSVDWENDMSGHSAYLVGDQNAYVPLDSFPANVPITPPQTQENYTVYASVKIDPTTYKICKKEKVFVEGKQYSIYVKSEEMPAACSIEVHGETTK